VHAHERAHSVALIRGLLCEQQPQWAELSLVPLPPRGTDNALYRLGEELVVRLPRVDWADEDVDLDARWLPVLAPHLPLAVPEPVAVGHPTTAWPHPWAVLRWLPGEDAWRAAVDDPVAAAHALAAFVQALQRVDPAGGRRPLTTPGASGRGGPLALRDAATRAALADLGDRVDVRAATSEWERSLAAAPYDGPGVWLHGDLTPGNLLVRDGRLVGVLDFGALRVGDPAVDLLPAWNWLRGEARDAYRCALGVDDATWQRGRGWALSVALVALPYYWASAAPIVASSKQVLRELLED
jgi:aminoglycoside phosphotransferase (APT) family kinase protein